MVHLFYLAVPAFLASPFPAVGLRLPSLRLFPFFDKAKKELLTSLFVADKKCEKIVRHFRFRPHANPTKTEKTAMKNISSSTKTLHSPK